MRFSLWAVDELRWSWYGKMLMHGKSGGEGHKCMLAQVDYNVVSNACNNDEGTQSVTSAQFMYFYFDGEQIKSIAASATSSYIDKCMQCGDNSGSNDADKNVVFRTCDGTVAQQWCAPLHTPLILLPRAPRPLMPMVLNRRRTTGIFGLRVMTMPSHSHPTVELRDAGDAHSTRSAPLSSLEHHLLPTPNVPGTAPTV